MSQDELLPEDLNDCQRVLTELVPRASRIDRDRLMIRLGERSAARGSRGWKWATAASLTLAIVLGLRPVLDRQATAPAQLAVQGPPAAPRSPQPESLRPAQPDDAAPLPAVPAIDVEAAWLLAVANGQYNPSGMLTVRPQSAMAELATRAGNSSAPPDISPDTTPTRRAPMLRWGDRPLWRETVDLTAPPTS